MMLHFHFIIYLLIVHLKVFNDENFWLFWNEFLLVLIGGATGTIGDPSGRTSERMLQTLETVQENVEGLSSQMKKLFGKDANVTIVNNYDWLSSLTLLDFLRSYGKDFNINTISLASIVLILKSFP